MFDNKFTRRDPLAESVRQVMIENDIRRQVELTLNEQLGIQSRKQLPHEYLKEYDETLRAAINQTLNEWQGDTRVKTPLGQSGSGSQHARETVPTDAKNKAVDDNVTNNRKKTDESISNPPEKTTPGFTKEESEGSNPRNNREKDLAAKKPPYNKITHADVLKGRGVIAQEELNVALGKNQITRKDPAAPSALAEKLTKKMSAGDVISDFVHSDNPKFAGKSKKKRKEMALAAYYSKQREKKSVNEEVSAILEEIRDNLQEQFVYIYENYDESVMEQFLASLTMEEAYLLGINEETEEESVKAAAAEKENPKPSMDVGGGLPPPAAPTTGWTPKVTPASPEVKR